MASVFQRGNRWIASFKNARGLWSTRSCGRADKQTAMQRAVGWEQEAQDMRAGRIDPVAENCRAEALRPLGEHLAEWKQSLCRNTPRHVELVTSRAAKVFVACGFKTWADVVASKVQAQVADLHADKPQADGGMVRGISAQTHNFYLGAVKQFSKWMVKDGRAERDKLAHLEGLNVATDRRHDRRVFSLDERRWLLDVTANGYGAIGSDGKPLAIVDAVERFGMSPVARAMLYRVALETGLRAGELRSLTRSSFELADEPAVSVTAGQAKNRTAATIPLRPATAAALADYMANRMPHTPAFNMPSPSRVVTMLRRDLADARKAYLSSLRTPQERTEAERGTFCSTGTPTGWWAIFMH